MTLDAVKNFAKVTVSIGYDAAATSIALTTGHGARLPAPSTDGAFNLVWWNSTDYADPTDDPNVEIVRCTGRSTDTLTITRAQEGTSASTKNTSAKTYSMILAVTAKMITDLNAQIIPYAADTGTTDAYAITISPAPLAYETGKTYCFKANTANTGTATLNICSLGAINIKKNNDQTLADNDIEAGQFVLVTYDGTNFQMQSQIANAAAGSSPWSTGSGTIYPTTTSDKVGVGHNAPTSMLHVVKASIGQTQDNAYGLFLENTTASTSTTTNQHSPPILFKGAGWRSEGTSGSKTTLARMYLSTPNGYNGDGVTHYLIIQGNGGNGSTSFTDYFYFYTGQSLPGWFYAGDGSSFGGIGAYQIHLVRARTYIYTAEHGSNDYNGVHFDMRAGTKMFYLAAGVSSSNYVYLLQDTHLLSGKGIYFDAAVSSSYNGYGDTPGDTSIVKSTASNGYWRYKYDGVVVNEWSDKVQTTDATATNLWTETLSDNQVHVIEALVVARRSDSADRWSGKRRVTVYRAGGGATILGSVETIGTDVTTGLAPTVTFDASTNDIRLRITGESAKTIQWRALVNKVHAN